MDSLSSAWSALDARRHIIVALAAVAVFATVIALSRAAASPDMALLYAGLDSTAAGAVVTALEQSGVAYEVRGDSIFVDASRRDVQRMTLAAEGLPAASGKGYELLDNLTGFGTNAQMFDAAYWRAKEGELARTILAAPNIRAARVHISTPTNRPFQREQLTTAAVTVTTSGGTLTSDQAQALRYLVAAAVAGLMPADVAVIDAQGGLIPADGSQTAGGRDSRPEELRQRAQRLLEARVGTGNAVVELTVETVTESESIFERRLDPESRVAISTDIGESTSNSQNPGGADVTVASNLPDGDAGGGGGLATSEDSESRALTNYEVSETSREVIRAPGGVRRLTVTVLVNDPVTVDAAGVATFTPRPPDELEALRELVASAVGLDETRGDIITVRSMSFEPLPILGTEAFASGAFDLDIMTLIKLGVLALVALVLGLFVVRPILTSGRTVGALPKPDAFDALPPFNVVDPSKFGASSFGLPAPGPIDEAEEADPVARLRRLIEERQEETAQILQNWIEQPDERERA